jgi:murein DD-endopeptidase MepM/ murein hydrolase activator NlpD/GH24 family phage-related lysozyme (muramidase)
MDPDTFADDSETYKALTDSSANSYTEDNDDLSSYDPTSNSKEEAEYLNNESDTLKLLVKQMIGYDFKCYGIYGTTKVKNADGTISEVCAGGVNTLINNKTFCADLVKSETASFAEMVSYYFGTFFFGINDTLTSSCKDSINANGGYKDYATTISTTPKLSEDKYWEFLENSTYFDKKAHLQYRFAKILTATNYETMTEFYNRAAPEVQEKYKNDIVEARKGIVEDIKDIVKEYGDDAKSTTYNSSCSDTLWWPIGSFETTEKDGITYAIGTPATVYVSSPYGYRSNPVPGVHQGVDIGGGAAEYGSINIIAAKDGVVDYVNPDHCVSSTDVNDNCGGGYGNHVIIKHADGTYTLYAHMHQDSVTVKVGDSVKQGEVIGKMGSSGMSDGMHLHFEVRTDANTRVDPQKYISAENPRPTGSCATTSGELATFIGNFEGTGPTNGDNYVVYCNKGDVPTVGHGLALMYNVARFAKYGIDTSTLTCGSEVAKDVCDKVYEDRLNEDKTSVEAELSSHGITLNENQINALSSLHFNCGNINGFFDAYSTYGSTDNLCTGWWNSKANSNSGGTVLQGLITRRQKECSLFVNGS